MNCSLWQQLTLFFTVSIIKWHRLKICIVLFHNVLMHQPVSPNVHFLCTYLQAFATVVNADDDDSDSDSLKQVDEMTQYPFYLSV